MCSCTLGTLEFLIKKIKSEKVIGKRYVSITLDDFYIYRYYPRLFTCELRIPFYSVTSYNALKINSALYLSVPRENYYA